ncbi:hypothetical protein AAHC03_024262 [Spirometra sp. Aus1]
MHNNTANQRACTTVISDMKRSRASCCNGSCVEGEVCVCSLTSLTFFLITLGLAVGGLVLTSNFQNFETVTIYPNGSRTDEVDIRRFAKFSAGLAITVLAFFFLIPATICCVCAIQYAQTNVPSAGNFDVEAGTTETEEPTPPSTPNRLGPRVRMNSV